MAKSNTQSAKAPLHTLATSPELEWPLSDLNNLAQVISKDIVKKYLLITDTAMREQDDF